MVFDFLRPVFTGDTIRCVITITQFERVNEHINMAASWECHNQNGKLVLTGHTYGIIRETGVGCLTAKRRKRIWKKPLS